MILLPYLIFSFVKSMMVDKSKLRKHTLIEYYRREIMRWEPDKVVLFFAPEVYDLEYFIQNPSAETFVIPPKSSLVDFYPDKKSRIC